MSCVFSKSAGVSQIPYPTFKHLTPDVSLAELLSCPDSITSVLLDIKKKIKKMKSYYDQLTEVLADILANHFPLPTADASAGKRKKVKTATDDDRQTSPQCVLN